MQKVEAVVTKKANPMVHRVAFAGMSQGDNELIQQYIVRQRSSAKDCNFSCPLCYADISSEYIKYQFICGINNQTLQTDMLAKAEHLTNVEETVKHAEAFETAISDQIRISS